jgi:two-component system sensor histidine kinase RegB
MTDPDRRSVPYDSSSLRLQTIIRLRWFAVTGQLLALLLVRFGLEFELPLALCLIFILLSAGLNIFLGTRYDARHRLSVRLAAWLLAYDILQLGALLYLTGGTENPFLVLIAAPVTVSAAGLPWRNTVLLGLLACLTVALLTIDHVPLPWYAGQTFAFPPLYKAGMAAAVIATMVFLALYVARLSREARQMSEALAATELVLAREQKLHAIDGLAAAAAHELGTPLSTITLIARELERDLPPDSPYAEDAALLKSQADRCREILRKLTQSPSESDPLHTRLPVSQLIEEAAAPYRDLDSEIIVTAAAEEGASGEAAIEPVLLRKPGVVFGLGNLIENAADFARKRVDVTARWSGATIVCTIMDDGPGFPAGIIDRLGEPYVTTRPALERMESSDDHAAGLGLGFFIAKTLLERSGATVEFLNRSLPETGALVRIIWPRHQFEDTYDEPIWRARNPRLAPLASSN